jgi:hypothetical protein
VTAVHKAPGDFPGGTDGDVLTVEFKVLGIPCLGLNGGPEFKRSEAFPSRSGLLGKELSVKRRLLHPVASRKHAR